ncbi:hypothetical protein VTI74DRAFT_3879 [Chaetomium olivicolor]
MRSFSNSTTDHTTRRITMAAALGDMRRGRSRAIKQNAFLQLRNSNNICYDSETSADIPRYSVETMALMVACLNHRYRGKNVYLALLDPPGLDLAAFPPFPRNNLFLFRQYHGVWSAAWLRKREHRKVGLFATKSDQVDDGRQRPKATMEI